MKYKILPLVAFISINVSAQTAKQVYKRTSSIEKASNTVTLYFSGSNSRVEMTDTSIQFPNGNLPTTDIIKNGTSSVVYSLNVKDKTYTTHVSGTNLGYDNHAVSLKIIGKEKIGKYNCIHSQITQGTTINDYWTTKEIPDYDVYKKTSTGNTKFMRDASEQAEMVKNNVDGCIIKATTLGEPGGITITTELILFEQKELPASLFEVPADYKLVQRK